MINGISLKYRRVFWKHRSASRVHRGGDYGLLGHSGVSRGVQMYEGCVEEAEAFSEYGCNHVIIRGTEGTEGTGHIQAINGIHRVIHVVEGVYRGRGSVQG